MKREREDRDDKNDKNDKNDPKRHASERIEIAENGDRRTLCLNGATTLEELQELGLEQFNEVKVSPNFGFIKEISNIVKLCPNLTSLDLSECDNLSLEGIRGIVATCPAIRCFNFSNTNLKTDETKKIVSEFPTIESFDFSKCKGMEDFIILSEELELTSLNFSGCEKLQTFVLSSLSSITSLDLSNCRQLQDFLLSNMPQLESLDLSNCSVVPEIK